MATGKVKWFNNAKGYGFILSDEGGDDLFAHYSSIQMDGYRTLKAGQPVEFDIQQGPKGFHAVNIRAAAEDMHSETAAAADLDTLDSAPDREEMSPTEASRDESDESAQERDTHTERAPLRSVFAESR